MKKELSLKENLTEWAKAIASAFIIAILLSNFVIINATIPTGSMINTINIGDRLLANRLAFLFSEPERGDIAIFDSTDNPGTLFVKRIIGLPGESVKIDEGTVYINNEPLLYDYTDIITIGDFGPYKVPEGKYFMLGDNRNESLDSRYWTNKFVPIASISGKVFIKYFPEINLIN